jgi:ATP-binding cassette, subfamily B, bacterial
MAGSPPPGALSLRERFGALRNLPPFLTLVWQTSPALTIGTLVLRLVRALLPRVQWGSPERFVTRAVMSAAAKELLRILPPVRRDS